MNLSRFALFAGMGLHFAATLSVILQQIILVPVFSAYWGGNLYSSWLIMFSAANLLVLADLGLNPLSIVRLQTALASGERPEEGKLRSIVANSAGAYGTIFISVVAIAPLIIFLLPVPALLGLNGAADFDLRMAFLITVVGSVTTVMLLGLTAILRVTNSINSISLVRVNTAIVATVLMYLAVAGGFGIVGVASAYAAANILEMLIMMFILAPRALAAFRTFRFSMRDEPLTETLRQARPNIIPISAEVILQSVPTFVMGVIGTSAVGVVIYTLSRLVLSSIRQVAITVMFPFSAPIGHAWARGDKDRAAAIIVTCLVIVGAGIGAGIGYFWSFQFAVVEIWTGGAYRSDPVVFALLFANIATAFPAVVAWHALMFIGQPVVVSKSKSLQIAMLVALCVILGMAFDVRGVAAGIFISEFMAVSVILVWALIRRFPIRIGRLLLSSGAPLGIMFALSYACAELAQSLLPPTDLGALILSSLFWLPAPAAAFLFTFYVSTKSSVRGA